MFDEYFELYKYATSNKNIDYFFMKEVESRWNKLTTILFSYSSKKDIISALTTTFFDLRDIEKNNYKEYFKEFTSYLHYASDRMNINRWARLQILLANAINIAYGEENIYERGLDNE